MWRLLMGRSKVCYLSVPSRALALSQLVATRVTRWSPGQSFAINSTNCLPSPTPILKRHFVRCFVSKVSMNNNYYLRVGVVEVGPVSGACLRVYLWLAGTNRRACLRWEEMQVIIPGWWHFFLYLFIRRLPQNKHLVHTTTFSYLSTKEKWKCKITTKRR